MGEIWQEIVVELEMEGVKLVPPDGEAADTILRATEERGLGERRTKEIDSVESCCFSSQRWQQLKTIFWNNITNRTYSWRKPSTRT